MMGKPELKIGAKIEVVFDNEINRSNHHCMTALVYDTQEDRIIVSQTSPALTSHFLSRRILITFLATVESSVRRYGIFTRLFELQHNYRLAAGNEVAALVLVALGKPDPVDFRMHFRVRPPAGSNVHLYLDEEKVNVTDISLGGARFSCPKSRPLFYGDTVRLQLVVEHTLFETEARVCHLSLPHGYSASRALQFAGVEFAPGNKRLNAALSRVVIGIERQLLCEKQVD